MVKKRSGLIKLLDLRFLPLNRVRKTEEARALKEAISSYRFSIFRGLPTISILVI